MEVTYKISIFGPGGVGKTTLARRFLTGMFETDLKMTMGAEIFVKHLQIEDFKVILQIWDFGGEKAFRFLLPAYARGSSAGIFMYDITRYATLTHIEDWLDTFKKRLDNDVQVPIFLVGGKKDLEEKRSVSIEEAKNLARKLEFTDFYECSSKSGFNIEKIFEDLTRLILKYQGVL
ncbi:MAG: GTP-binding protein [Promethearchaeota archaeon]|nr:MAG: GTP-binding protein [Candidatus Lokiarchaeota archaeon]